MPLIRRNSTIRRSRAASWARLAGGLSLPVLALGVVGLRVGFVPETAIEPVLVVGFMLGLAALLLAGYALADIWVSGAEGTGTAIVGVLYASPVLAILALIAAAAVIYPRVADVVTDVDDPPVFTGPDGPHAAPEAAGLARQIEGYPDLAPRSYPLPLGDVYVAARKIVDTNKWTVTREVRPADLPMASGSSAAQTVADDDELTQALAAKTVMTQSRGGMATETSAAPGPAPAATTTDEVAEPPPDAAAEIEAIAPTLVFGFRDDVLIRFKVADDGSTQVDLRSVSQIGAHDLGENVRRIKAYFEALDLALQPELGAPGAAAAAGQ